MQVPLEWSHRGLSRREADLAEALVRQLAGKLEHFAPDLISCRVAVERSQGTTRHGSPFRVRVEATLPPGKSLVSVRGPEENGQHEEMEQVVRRAFASMNRQVKETSRRRRGDVKHHQPTDGDQGFGDHGFVVRLYQGEGYGFIKTPQGDEIYMHRNSVLHEDFDDLEIGTQVRFVSTLGDEGPQTTSVQIIDKPGVRARPKRPEVNPDLPAGWER